MKVRNIVRKAAVLGSSAALMGTTLMGALAYDLADYPAQFIVDGQFDGTIVVGERAATADVLGSIDIAASLQAASVSEEAVEVPGQVGEIQLEGDAFKIEQSSDLLELREPVGAVYDTLTSDDLEALTGGSLTTDEGSTDYLQVLRFGENTADALQVMAVNYAEDENNVLGDYLVVDDNEPFFEWEIEFSEGLESEVTVSSGVNGELEDLEDEVFNIFGTPYTFVDSAITTNTGALTLEFMAGQVSDTLREGETRTYSIDGVDYEVTLVFVSDPNTGSAEAKFSVNGELTDALTDGDTDTLSGGLQIGVRDLLVNSREGVVSFFLGAEKVEFTDSTTTSESFNGDVEIGDENIEDATVAIQGSFTQSDNSTFEITSVKYRLTADATDGSTLFLPPGHGVREFLDEPEGLLSPTFDVQYHGLTEVGTTPVGLESQSDHSYDLVITNLRGKTYDFPFVTNQDGTFLFGDDDDDFWFSEVTPVGGQTNHSSAAGDFRIGDDDYFAVSENAVGSASEKDDSAILRYEDIDTSDRILTFTDLSSGETKTVSYQTTSSFGDAIGVATNFNIEGNTYTVFVGPTDFNLSIDLNGDDDVAGDEVGFTVKGGGVLDYSNVTPTVASGRARVGGGGTGVTILQELRTPANQFDDSSLGGDSLNWTLASAASNEVTAGSPSTYGGPLEASANDPWGDFQLVNDDDDDDYDRGMTDYGALVEYYNPSGDDAEEITISYPEQQRGAQVFVVAGTVEASEGGAGTITREVVNPIAVGLAVLDRDAPAVGSENLIVVGGPCANSVAAALLGNPAECGEGFEPGKAVIRAWDQGDTVAILVAGYEASETQAASRVLANSGDYALSGSQVEVVGTDFSSLTVRAVGESMEDEA